MATRKEMLPGAIRSSFADLAALAGEIALAWSEADVEELLECPDFNNQAAKLSVNHDKVEVIREVICKDRVKVVFFGRTGSGKSSAINALLGQRVLPTGLGRTTASFTEVRGSNRSKPCLVTMPKGRRGRMELTNLDAVVNDVFRHCDSPALILWPEERCACVSSDVVLVDSPGLDADSDTDAWIEDTCYDADLFIWVIDGESTVNMAEKRFFARVAEKVSKPNLLALINRWDRTAEEEEYVIDAARSQHVEKMCEFLVNELGVAASTEEAERRVFFVSTKEALTGYDAEDSGQRERHRRREWQRFEASIANCAGKAADALRMTPHLDTAATMAAEDAEICSVLAAACSQRLPEWTTKQRTLERNATAFEDALNCVIPSMKKSVLDLSLEVNKSVDLGIKRLDKELTLTSEEFEGIFHENLAASTSFVGPLRTQLEERIKEQLNMMAHGVSALVDEAQKGILREVKDAVPKEKRDFVLEIEPRRLPLDLKSLIDEEPLRHFTPDLRFRPFLHPSRLWQRTKAICQTLPRCTTWLLVASEASLVASFIAACAISKSVLNWRNLALASLAVLSSTLCERALWTSAAKEKATRLQAKCEAFRVVKSSLASIRETCGNAARKEAATTLVLACGAAEGAQKEIASEATEAREKCQKLRRLAECSETSSRAFKTILSQYEGLKRKIIEMK